MLRVHTETAPPIHPDKPHCFVREGTRIGKSSGIRNTGFNSGIPLEAGKQRSSRKVSELELISMGFYVIDGHGVA